jgi:hypothetical protein
MACRILFILKWRVVPYDGYGRNWGWIDPGTPTDPSAKLLSHGLNNSCRFVVDMLNDASLEARLVQVADDNEIWKEIVDFEPDLVIIEAYWMRPKKLADLADRFPGLPIVIRGHSSTPFLAEDWVGFPWAVDYLAAGGVVGQNDERHVEEMRFLARSLFSLDGDESRQRVPYLPNYYPPERPYAPRPPLSEFIDIGCFGAIRSFKNHVGQAIAAMAFADQIGKRLRFHINGDRLERGGASVSRALDAIFSTGNADLVRHSWIPTHDAFLLLVAEMDIVMQISFAETFNIVAADAVSQGVPAVGSAEIPWLSRHYQASPTQPKSMIAVLHHAWNHRHQHWLDDPNLTGLRHWATMSRRIWLRWLSSI